jgi:hypothetical protein
MELIQIVGIVRDGDSKLIDGESASRECHRVAAGHSPRAESQEVRIWEVIKLRQRMSGFRLDDGQFGSGPLAQHVMDAMKGWNMLLCAVIVQENGNIWNLNC